MVKTDKYVRVQGRLLKLTNTSKVFFPGTGFTKQDVLNYYRDMGAVVLPHLRNRPFTLNRFPDGVTGPSFYEKQCPHHRESWVQTGNFGAITHCLVNDLATLLWVVNLAAIELHTTLGAIADLQRPTAVVFDLDPGERADMRQCVEVASLARATLSKLGLDCFAKTSGRKGLHVYVPLNTSATFVESREFARKISEDLEARYPDLITSRMLKRHRVGRVYIDWHQNVDFKTTVCVYSLRAKEPPTVSTPVTWREIAAARKQDSEAAKLLSFETSDVLARVRKHGDLFRPVLELAQRLPQVSEVRTRLAA